MSVFTTWFGTRSFLFIGRKSARRRHALRDARRGILFGFYFPPQLVVDCIVFVPEETECFAVDKIFRFRKRNLAVADGRIFDEFSCSGIRSGVGNVVEVHFGNIRPAEEVDKFFCIFFVLCIFWNYPGINPEIRSFFWNYVLQIWILCLCIDGFSRINDTDGGSVFRL